MVLPSTLRVQLQNGGCGWGGSAWQRQLGLPQRAWRCSTVPGNTNPSPAISRVIRSTSMRAWGSMSTTRLLGSTAPTGVRSIPTADTVARVRTRGRPGWAAPAAAAPAAGPGVELVSRRLGALPLVNHFLQRSGLPALLERYLPV